MSHQFKITDIDRGEHKIPPNVKNQQDLIGRMNRPEEISEEVVPEPRVSNPVIQNVIRTDIGLSKHATEFIKNNLSATESLLSWYFGISNSKTRDHIMLGIPNFPIQVKVNTLNARLNGNSLTVFVKSDNALEISLPIASEVILNGKIGDVELDQRKGLFLGEVAFDKNFLFKILIFVLQ